MQDDGPLKGAFNGERKYNIEFPDTARPMGTFHFLDGAKVKIFHRGNTKTCGRCHKVAAICQGGGYAKDCERSGGQRVDLAQHMRSLWQEINFAPTTFELPAQAEKEDNQNETVNGRDEGDIVISEDTTFRRNIERPEMTEDDIKKVVGIQIRNLPPTLSDDNLVEFLQNKVDITIERVSIMKNEHSLNASIENGLEGSKVIAAAKELEFRQSKKKFFDKPLYCRFLKNLTPEKTEPPVSNHNVSQTSTPRKDLNPELKTTKPAEENQ